jgi:hypothetical protein
MNASNIYIAISIIALAIIALPIFILGKSQEKKRLTPIASLAFGFIVAGIVFGGNRLIGYSLMGIGVVLSLIDMFRMTRSR